MTKSSDARCFRNRVKNFVFFEPLGNCFSMNHPCRMGFQEAARRAVRWFGAGIWLMAASMPKSHGEEIPSAPASSHNATNATPSSAEGVVAFKKMSLEELMAQDVTSVSRQPQPYGQAPAAIQVITGDEIRRSGASSIPEALRLADNLDVAQKNSSSWDISARGFNSSIADKLLVMIDGRSIYT